MTTKAYMGVGLIKYRDGDWVMNYLSWSRDPKANKNVPYRQWHVVDQRNPPKCTGKDWRSDVMTRYASFRDSLSKLYDSEGQPKNKTTFSYAQQIDGGVIPMELFY